MQASSYTPLLLHDADVGVTILKGLRVQVPRKYKSFLPPSQCAGHTVRPNTLFNTELTTWFALSEASLYERILTATQATLHILQSSHRIGSLQLYLNARWWMLQKSRVQQGLTDDTCLPGGLYLNPQRWIQMSRVHHGQTEDTRLPPQGYWALHLQCLIKVIIIIIIPSIIVPVPINSYMKVISSAKHN